MKNKPTNSKIGIALSGGGARGLAHIGVLHALNENGIFPSRVSGCSSGAIIAALYCSGISPLKILELSKDKSFEKIFHFRYTAMGLSEHKALHGFLLNIIGDSDFNSLKTPFSVSVTNINKGNNEIINAGKILPVVIASCSIPILFKPVEIGGYLYVDGGLTNNLPIEPLLSTCDKVIGIGVSQHMNMNHFNGMRDIALRCFHLAIWNTMEGRMKKCDLAIDITANSENTLFNLKHGQELFEIGRAAVMENLDKIIELSN